HGVPWEVAMTPTRRRPAAGIHPRSLSPDSGARTAHRIEGRTTPRHVGKRNSEMTVSRYVLVVLVLSTVAAAPGQAAQGHAPASGGPPRTSGKAGGPGPGGGTVATHAGRAAQGQAAKTGGLSAPGRAAAPGPGGGKGSKRNGNPGRQFRRKGTGSPGVQRH